jgi:ribA/ribD-fused uncharacterized protein
MTNSNRIFFWNDDKYAAFSNFWEADMCIDGKMWDTVEHYFQAMKTINPHEQEMVRMAKSPGSAKRMGRGEVTLRPDWEQVKYEVMKKALRAKFRIPEMKALLLESGDAEIYEDSPYDKIWGTGEKGGVGTGQNLLGKALMEIRAELQK